VATRTATNLDSTYSQLALAKPDRLRRVGGATDRAERLRRTERQVSSEVTGSAVGIDADPARHG